jgi:hypothetical protein
MTRPRCSNQCTLGGVRQVTHVAAHVRPHRGERVAALRLDQKENQPALDGRDEAALDGEPALTELLGIVGAGQDRPELGVVAGLVKQGGGTRPCAGLSSDL